MSAGIPFAVWLAAAMLVAALSGTRMGARVALLVPIALLPLPMFIQGELHWRALMSALVMALFAAAGEFAHGRIPRGFGHRMLCVLGLLALADVWRAEAVPRRFDWRAIVRMCAGGLVVAGGLLLWQPADALETPLRWTMHTLIAAILVLAVAEFLTGVVGFATAAAGTRLPPVHDAPFLARSVAEFWNARWNLVTGRWLKRNCYVTFAHRGATFALLMTFVLSAAAHSYLLAAVDTVAALSCGAFFLAQPAVIRGERILGVRRWPEPWGRAWTFVVLAAPLPLLVWPFFAYFGLRF